MHEPIGHACMCVIDFVASLTLKRTSNSAKLNKKLSFFCFWKIKPLHASLSSFMIWSCDDSRFNSQYALRDNRCLQLNSFFSLLLKQQFNYSQLHHHRRRFVLLFRKKEKRSVQKVNKQRRENELLLLFSREWTIFFVVALHALIKSTEHH